MDNDSYGHVNNVTYYSYFDTAVNEHLIRCGGLDIGKDPVIGYVVETSCRFAKPLSFPETIDVGLRVVRLGTTSVTYEIGTLPPRRRRARGNGHFVHVWVDRATVRPDAGSAADSRSAHACWSCALMTDPAAHRQRLRRPRARRRSPSGAGGVEIPHTSADSTATPTPTSSCTRVCDAILGALALGDLGKHFPDSDPRWKGADSRMLLRHVAALAATDGWRVGNVDVTVIAQAPKVAPHVPAMRANLAADLACEIGVVSVKATTTEGLGFAGRGEGIAALASVMLDAGIRTARAIGAVIAARSFPWRRRSDRLVSTR